MRVLKFLIFYIAPFLLSTQAIGKSYFKMVKNKDRMGNSCLIPKFTKFFKPRFNFKVPLQKAMAEVYYFSFGEKELKDFKYFKGNEYTQLLEKIHSEKSINAISDQSDCSVLKSPFLKDLALKLKAKDYLFSCSEFLKYLIRANRDGLLCNSDNEYSEFLLKRPEFLTAELVKKVNDREKLVNNFIQRMKEKADKKRKEREAAMASGQPTITPEASDDTDPPPPERDSNWFRNLYRSADNFLGHYWNKDNEEEDPSTGGNRPVVDDDGTSVDPPGFGTTSSEEPPSNPTDSSSPPSSENLGDLNSDMIKVFEANNAKELLPYWGLFLKGAKVQSIEKEIQEGGKVFYRLSIEKEVAGEGPEYLNFAKEMNPDIREIKFYVEKSTLLSFDKLKKNTVQIHEGGLYSYSKIGRLLGGKGTIEKIFLEDDQIIQEIETLKGPKISKINVKKFQEIFGGLKWEEN